MTGSTGPTSNPEIVQSFYDAGEAEVDHFYEIIDDDVEWIHPALGGIFHGVDSVVEDVLQPFRETWDLSIDFERVIDDGDMIIVLATYRGTYKPTDNQVEEPVAHVWSLDGGKITQFQQYIDTASVQEQIEE